MTLSGAVAYGETVTLAYAAPATAALQDGAGNAVAGFSGQAVTNWTTQGPVPPEHLQAGTCTDSDPYCPLA